jgi:hypothetical protein
LLRFVDLLMFFKEGSVVLSLGPVVACVH